MISASIKEIVKDNTASFSFYRSGNLWYKIAVAGVSYIFPISVEEIGGTTFLASYKAITLMRWIRKAIADQTFTQSK